MMRASRVMNDAFALRANIKVKMWLKPRLQPHFILLNAFFLTFGKLCDIIVYWKETLQRGL
jgi:hypothetical protein